MKTFKVLGYIVAILCIAGLMYSIQDTFFRFLILGLALVCLGYNLYKDLSCNK